MSGFYYRFKNISVEQFAAFEDSVSDNHPADFRVSASFDWNNGNHVLKNTMAVSVLQENVIKLKVVLCCLFDIKEESITDATHEDGTIVFPKSLLIQLASLNYGTMRGIIYERIKDTALPSIILPPLYMENIVKEDFIVKSI